MCICEEKRRQFNSTGTPLRRPVRPVDIVNEVYALFTHALVYSSMYIWFHSCLIIQGVQLKSGPLTKP